MLAHNIAWFGSDLWGLGWIIYQCLTGVPPFRGENEAGVFEAIFEGKLFFPPDMDENAMDLIQKLLVIDPRKRLGAGSKKEKLSMKDLKKHSFFKGKKLKNM